MKKVLFFSGSNSPKSINQSLITAVSELFKQSENTIISLRDFPMPIYSIETEQKEGIPENTLKLKARIDATDALVISVPEHNGSIPAVFKNSMDWLSRADKNYKILKNKNIVLFSTSAVGGGANSIIHAETILKRLGASVTGKVVISKFNDQLYEVDGVFRIKDEVLLKEITELVALL